MSEQENTIIFPLDRIQSEFLQGRNTRAIESVQEAVRLVSTAVNVPDGLQVAPNDELTALVVAKQEQQALIEPPSVEAEVEKEADLINLDRLWALVFEVGVELTALTDGLENPEKLNSLQIAFENLDNWVDTVTHVEDAEEE